MHEKADSTNSCITETIEQEAVRYIRCSKLRPKLPTIKLDKNLVEWTQWQVLELCKCETDKDAVNVAKDAIKMASVVSRHAIRHCSRIDPWNLPGDRMEHLTTGPFTSRPALLKPLAVLANLIG